MKNIAFTICAKNYIGLAQVLEKSVKKHNPDIVFFIVIADELHKTDSEIYDDNIICAKDIVGFSPEKWDNLSFKYDLTEFCTAIKPSCMKHFLSELDATTCIYFDPDILVFHSFDTIYQELQEYSIILTPHITTIETNYTGDLPESGLLYTGMFNLGFLALKSDLNSSKMLDWWECRLEDRCFQNKMESYFTDQKWMDFLPSFFSKELLISFHLGMNLAPWNFYEREIFVSDGKYYVRNRFTNSTIPQAVPLIFVHFSGFNYNFLLESKVSQDNLSLRAYSDIDLIMNEYSIALKESFFSKFVKMPYSFAYFTNGIEVTKTYRRLYRRITEDGNIMPKPFDAEGKFYIALKNSGVLNRKLTLADKKSVARLEGVSRKLSIINRTFYYSFKLLGSEKFFMLVRLMRIYSKVENHVYLIDDKYLRTSKIRD